ncbi:SAM-dependent RNA methyltransferase [Endogone sp. FLAS-F59071]|nr:SAM-dependent RNA methyltransferase [Endogone sp. FLAS-F59071]|eukprot:RUS15763.1 SAM-dependent RNA methyltransferase [Endogone sp. FLAS-F59071]
MPNYIVEHMEDALHDWCVLEYQHMLTIVGPECLYFSSLTPAAFSALPDSLRLAHCHAEDVLQLPGVQMGDVCLLDPAAGTELAPEDGERFRWFLFGGILGDDPPRDRTGELRKLGFTTRHLGPVQMTTDTALSVTRRVVEDKVSLFSIPYIDHPEIKFTRKESVIMPFRYVATMAVVTGADGTEKTVRRPVMPPGMIELLKKDNEKGFEF